MENQESSHHFDAIVIGSGISGGWAAKELCEKGLKTLVLERGREVKHIQDYPTAMKHPWEFENGFAPTQADQKESPVQSTCYTADNKHFFVKDSEHPYIQDKPFHWIRGYQVGGRSLTWGRQCYRFSDLDFNANKLEGVGVDWPIRYADLAPWYDYVENFVGISGQKENMDHFPDGQFLPPIELNCVENHLKQSLKKNFNTILTPARLANLTKPHNGRGQCMNRNMCSRGCPYGAYFSSNSATLPAAVETGNMTLYPNALVVEILYDHNANRATGVRVLDTETKETKDFFARIIFVNASTIATAALLLRSTSSHFPNGLGNSNGVVGRYLMDHHSYAGGTGRHDGFQDSYYRGRRPGSFIIPRFRNVHKDDGLGFLRGYGIQGHGERQEWMDRSNDLNGFGKDFKKELLRPGPWTVWMGGWGECLPYETNRVYLDFDEKDPYGLPMVRINFEYGENEFKMMQDIRNQVGEMLEATGFENVSTYLYPKPGGSTIHEMGTARMGNDPETSVLNAFNQMHEVPNVFITDGSCMTSSGSLNPSLTYMALTARACSYAVDQLKKGAI
jgi:choline dehydrogenase-like flavoprotein